MRDRSPRRSSRSEAVRHALANPSKRQLSRWEREHRLQRLLYLSAAALALLVVAIFAFGVFREQVQRPSEVIATVYGKPITLGQFAEQLRYTAAPLDRQIERFRGAGRNSSLQQQLQQLETQRRLLPDQVLTAMIENEIIAHEAELRGITVSPEEVQERINRDMALQYDLQQPKPSPTPAPTATEGPSPLPSPTPVGSPTPFPSSTPPNTLPPDDTQTQLRNFLQRTNRSEELYRADIKAQLLRDKLSKVIGEERTGTPEQAHLRHIVAKDTEAANAIFERLKNGESFEEIAKAESTDTATAEQGGDLGWVVKGLRSPEFDNAAFALQPGQFSDVLQTEEGPEIVMMVERDPNRPVDPAQLEQLRQENFRKWLENETTGENVKQTLTPEQRAWAVQRSETRS